jgi:hypothetical protein
MRGAWVGVPGGDLDVAEIDAGVEHLVKKASAITVTGMVSMPSESGYALRAQSSVQHRLLRLLASDWIR